MGVCVWSAHSPHRKSQAFDNDGFRVLSTVNLKTAIWKSITLNSLPLLFNVHNIKKSAQATVKTLSPDDTSMRQHLNGTFQKKSLFIKKKKWSILLYIYSEMQLPNHLWKFFHKIGGEQWNDLFLIWGLKAFSLSQKKVPHTKKEIQCKPLFLYHESPFKHQSNQFLRACVVYSKSQRRYLSLYSLQHFDDLLLKYDIV